MSTHRIDAEPASSVGDGASWRSNFDYVIVGAGSAGCVLADR